MTVSFFNKIMSELNQPLVQQTGEQRNKFDSQPLSELFEIGELYYPPEGQKYSVSVKRLLFDYGGLEGIIAGLNTSISRGISGEEHVITER